MVSKGRAAVRLDRLESRCPQIGGCEFDQAIDVHEKGNHPIGGADANRSCYLTRCSGWGSIEPSRTCSSYYVRSILLRSTPSPTARPITKPGLESFG